MTVALDAKDFAISSTDHHNNIGSQKMKHNIERNENISKRIKKKRIELKYSIRHAAKICGLQTSTFYNIETGNSFNPGILHIAAIAECFGVSVDYFLHEKDLLPSR